jgi:hypothetical protein
MSLDQLWLSAFGWRKSRLKCYYFPGQASSWNCRLASLHSWHDDMMAFIKATPSSLLSLAWFLAHVGAVDVVYDIDKVCLGVSGVIGCTTDIVYPTGATAVFCMF